MCHIVLAIDVGGRQGGEGAQRGCCHTLGGDVGTIATGEAAVVDEQSALVRAYGGGGVGDLQRVTVLAIGGVAWNGGHWQAEHLVVVAEEQHREVLLQILALDKHGEGERLAQCHLAHGNGCLQVWSDEHGVALWLFTTLAHYKGLALAVAPDVLGQQGVVDEGVAVVLYLIHRIVARHLLVAHGILARPLKQQVDRPLVEGEPRCVRHHVGIFPGVVLVAGGHVEIGACKVALILVVGLKHGGTAAALPCHWCAHLGAAVVEARCRYLAQRVVVLCQIGIAVAGIEVVEVGIGIDLRASPPALGEGVLAVHAAHRARATKVAGDVAIHVPHLVVVVEVAVGALEVVPQAAVGHHGVVLEQLVYGIFQVLSALAVDARVVASGHVSASAQCHKCGK